MIDKLTEKQKDLLIVYKNKWIEKGLNTKPVNRQEAEKIINDVYTHLLKKPKPRKVIITSSPRMAWWAVCLYKGLMNLYKNRNVELDHEVRREVRREMWQEAEQEVWQEVWQEVRQEVQQKVGQKVGREVWQEARQEVGQEVEKEVEQEVRQKVRREMWQEVWREMWQEVRREVEQEVLQKVRQEVWQEVRQEAGQEVKKEVRQEVEQEVEKEVRQEVQQKAGQEVKEEAEREVWQEVEKEVRQEVWQEVEKEVLQKVGREVGQEVEKEVQREVDKEVRQEVEQEVVQEVWQKVRQKVWREMWQEVGQKVRQKVRQKVWQEAEQKLWQKVKREVRQEVREEVGKEVKEGEFKMQFKWPYIDGKFSAGYLSFYDYINEVLGVEYDKEKKFDVYKKTSELELVYPFDNVCIVSDNFCEINRNDQGQLHKDMGAALSYKDGFGLYRLNGIRVPKEIVMTPADELDCKLVLTEKNAEVRREIIRKIGIDRVVSELGAKSVEKNDMYELLNFDIIDGRYRPYLKMRNPSIDAWHVEGVHPDCDTIEKALAWRNGQEVYQAPEILT